MGVYIEYLLYFLQIATLWTFYTRDFSKRVYLGSIFLVAVPTCRLPRLLDMYRSRKLADLLFLTFTIPGYWEGETPKVQQRGLFLHGSCVPLQFSFLWSGSFGDIIKATVVLNHFNSFPFSVIFNQVFKSTLVVNKNGVKNFVIYQSQSCLPKSFPFKLLHLPPDL